MQCYASASIFCDTREGGTTGIEPGYPLRQEQPAMLEKIAAEIITAAHHR